MIAYLLIAGGIISTITGIVLLRKGPAEKDVKTEVIAEVLESKSSPAATTDEENAAKGLLFEKYVVGKISRKEYRIVEWQGDKYHNGIYAESNMRPDLLLSKRDRNATLAIECKWRRNTESKSVQWSEPAQLERYRNFQKKESVAVYVVIGIGGEPSEPKELYIVPLNSMKHHYVYKDYLKRFTYGTEKEFLFL